MDQTVYIVDDDEAVRDSLSLWLNHQNYSVQSFVDAKSFLDQLTATQRGCIVSDIRMSGMSGLDLQQELLRRKCQLPIIFITGHGTVPMAVTAIREGALDYCRKPINEQELLARISEAFALEEESYCRHQAQAQLIQLFEQLTRREMQVTGFIAEGLANKVIAAKLNISERTVEVHRAHAVAKLQVTSVAQLVRAYVNYQAISRPEQ